MNRRVKPEKVTLRRSKALLAMETETIVFTTKLIDGTFPAYERIIPEASTNTITCDRGEIIAALKRIQRHSHQSRRWRAGGVALA